MIHDNDKLRMKGYKIADDIILNNNIKPLTVGSLVPYDDHNLAANLGISSQIYDAQDSIVLFKAKIVEIAIKSGAIESLEINQTSLIIDGLNMASGYYLMRENFDVQGQKELVDSIEDCDVEFDSEIHGRIDFSEAHRIIVGKKYTSQAPVLSA
jgi:hypothetical protein